jgi:hypothetical protein
MKYQALNPQFVRGMVLFDIGYGLFPLSTMILSVCYYAYLSAAWFIGTYVSGFLGDWLTRLLAFFPFFAPFTWSLSTITRISHSMNYPYLRAVGVMWRAVVVIILLKLRIFNPNSSPELARFCGKYTFLVMDNQEKPLSECKDADEQSDWYLHRTPICYLYGSKFGIAQFHGNDFIEYLKTRTRDCSFKKIGRTHWFLASPSSVNHDPQAIKNFQETMDQVKNFFGRVLSQKGIKR